MRWIDALRSVCLAAPFGIASASPSFANDKEFDLFDLSIHLAVRYYGPVGHVEPATSPVAVAATATYATANFDGTLEPGEPTDGGKMTKTVWADLRLPAKQRVVVDTFGSGFDTDLVAYTGTALAHLTRIAGNDDKTVPGLGTKQSLVQFDALANTDYHIQIGGKHNANGTISANVFVFPPTGGLAVFLASVGGTAVNGEDYVCYPTSFASCGAATFILYNSTSKTLTVSASSTLGAGVTAPVPFGLAPGAVKTAQFAFGPGFDKTTVRTVSGQFIFTGKSGATTVAQDKTRGLIVVKGSPLDVLRGDAAPQIEAGFINQPLPFTLKLTNSGAQTARGCYAASVASAPMKTIWQRVNPTSGAAIAGVDVPVDIPAGQSVSLKVTLERQQYQLAGVTASGSVILDCANTAPLASNLQNRFDTTNDGHDQPADMVATLLSPTNGVVSVPAAGGTFRMSAVNRGVTRTVKAYPKYEHPPLELAANKQFTATICQVASATANACLAAPTSAIQYGAAAGVTRYFKVFVKRPATDPGYDPAKRRMFLYFDQNPLSGFLPLPAGAESVAIKRS